MDDRKQLETALAIPIIVRAAGEDVEVRRLRTVQLLDALWLVDALLAALSAAGKIGEGAGIKEAVDIGWTDLLQSAYGPIADLVALSTGRSRQWFDELDADEGLAVAAAVLEVNLDFFLQRLLPQLLKLGPLVDKVNLALDSHRSSPPSSGPGTAGPTSSATPLGN